MTPRRTSRVPPADQLAHACSGGLIIDPDERNSPARAPSLSASPRPLASLVGAHSHATSHEQRIATLEADLHAIRAFLASQFNTASLPPSAPSPSSYSNLSYLATSPGAAQPAWASQSQASGRAAIEGARQQGYGQGQAYEDETSRRMTVSSGSSLLLNPGPHTLHDARGQKRGEQTEFDGGAPWKRSRIAEGELEIGMGDFIARGEIAEDEARLCFDRSVGAMVDRHRAPAGQG